MEIVGKIVTIMAVFFIVFGIAASIATGGSAWLILTAIGFAFLLAG